MDCMSSGMETPANGTTGEAYNMKPSMAVHAVVSHSNLHH